MENLKRKLHCHQESSEKFIFIFHYLVINVGDGGCISFYQRFVSSLIEMFRLFVLFFVSVEIYGDEYSSICLIFFFATNN